MKTLMQHQEYAINMMDLSESLGIFYEPGTGKTAIALEGSRRALKDGRVDSVLVACPAALVGNWKLSIDKMIEFEGVTPEDVDMLREKVFVTSYQKLYKRSTRIVHHRNGIDEKVAEYSLRDEVDKKWGAIFLDESQCASAHDARTTKTCLTLALLAKHRFPMTGTPVHGSSRVRGGRDFAKLYGQLNFIHPGLWPTWKAFCEQCVQYMDEWHKPMAYHTDVCEGLMQEYSITVRLADCVDMPPMTETEVPCELKAKAVYKDPSNGSYRKYNLLMENVGALGIKLLQVVSGSLKDDDDNVTVFESSKDDALRTILDGTEDKVVIFCNFTASVERCMRICKEAGRTPIQYNGEAKKDDWMGFQYGDADAIVCQYQVGSAGLDLYTSSTLVFFEPTRSTLNLTQAKARIRRTGQTNSMRYIYLSTQKTIEQKVWDSVRSGTDVTDEMLDRFAHGQ